MTPKQKAIELLSQMPEPYRTLALENLEKHKLESIYDPRNIQDALSCFYWSDTTPGFIWWSKVWRHYEDGTPLPELPLEYRCKQFVKENEELKRKVEKLESKINTRTK